MNLCILFSAEKMLLLILKLCFTHVPTKLVRKIFYLAMIGNPGYIKSSVEDGEDDKCVPGFTAHLTGQLVRQFG
jgi:hypothetical protein